MSATVRTQQHPPEPPERPVPQERHSTTSGRSRVSVRRTDGVAVVRPVGLLDRSLVDKVRRAALDVDRPVIIDLDDCVVDDADALERIAVDPQLSALPELCLVTRSAAAHALLTSVGVDHRHPLFKRVDDALLARTFAREGYGDGWTP